MIKEAIIIVGLVFYAFVISTLVKDISNSSFTQERKTLQNLSSELSITMRMVSSLSKKWKISTPALNMTERNSWKSSESTEEEPISMNFLNSSPPSWVTVFWCSAQDGREMCRKHPDCLQPRTFEEPQQGRDRKRAPRGLWSWWWQRSYVGRVQHLQPAFEEATQEPQNHFPFLRQKPQLGHWTQRNPEV